MLFFSLIFILKLDEPFRNEKIFIISLFFKSSDLCFFLSRKCFFVVEILLIFYPLDPDPWVFLRIRIREAKILRIQRIRIRILSTALNKSYLVIESHKCISLVLEISDLQDFTVKLKSFPILR